MKKFFSRTNNENPFTKDYNENGDNTDTMTEEVKENNDIKETEQEGNDITEEKVEDKEESETKTENEEQPDEYSVLKAQYEELNNNFLRLAADFDNYRKRQAQEREALLKYGAQECMKKIIEVVDNFDRAIQSVEKIEYY